MEKSKSRQVLEAMCEEESLRDLVNYSPNIGFGILVIQNSMLEVGKTYRYEKNTDTGGGLTFESIDGKMYDYAIVDSTGGYIGGGEDANRVFGIFEIDSETEATLIGFVQVNGFYTSYYGTEWDSSDEWFDVLPKEVTVVQYHSVAA